MNAKISESAAKEIAALFLKYAKDRVERPPRGDYDEAFRGGIASGLHHAAGLILCIAGMSYEEQTALVGKDAPTFKEGTAPRPAMTAFNPSLVGAEHLPIVEERPRPVGAMVTLVKAVTLNGQPVTVDNETLNPS